MRRGPKPKGKVALEWSSDLAYAVGLLTADGCLSKDGRHIDFTSKDLELVRLFKSTTGVDTRISKKRSGSGNYAYHTQFGDVLFYRFLEKLGLTKAKSKTIREVYVPETLFPDFLRGYFDGDGCSYSGYDPVFVRSFRFYISFTSASPDFLKWVREEIRKHVRTTGSIGSTGEKYSQLRYSKADAVKVYRFMYYQKGLPSLSRKRLKIERTMRIIQESRGGGIGRRAAFRSQWR